MMNFMSDVTRILKAIEAGDRQATEELLPLVYDELRRLARHRLSSESPGQALDSASLVHDAYLRLVDGPEERPWENRRHFFGAAAEAMRRILIDRARRRNSLKRGGDKCRIDLDSDRLAAEVSADDRSDDLLALDEALGKLERQEPLKAELVKLRFFAGLTNAQAAAALGISSSTADNYWAYARSWLRVELEEDSPAGKHE